MFLHVYNQIIFIINTDKLYSVEHTVCPILMPLTAEGVSKWDNRVKVNPKGAETIMHGAKKYALVILISHINHI